MSAAYLLLISNVLGQVYGYYPMATYAPAYNTGYGYGLRTPLQTLDPMRYNRFYSGEGFYTFEPPVIADPQVITLKRPETSASGVSPEAGAAPTSGTTGLVLALNEQKKQITLQIPAGTAVVSYGPSTHFAAADGDLPVIKPGNLINVNESTITILRRSQK